MTDPTTEVWRIYAQLLPYLVLVDILTYVVLGWVALRRLDRLPPRLVRILPTMAVVSVAILGWFPSASQAVLSWMLVVLAAMTRRSARPAVAPTS